MQVLYNKETGAICGTAQNITASSTYGIVSSNDTLNPLEEWVNLETGLLEHRPKFSISVDKTTIVANSTDTAKITGIPANTICTYEDAEHTITDGEIDFTAEHAGDYILTFSLWPYMDYSVTISATEAT